MNRESQAQNLLDSIMEEIASIEIGEPWTEELILTIKPNGRAVAELRDFGGTPTHDHVRKIIQRQRWPRGEHTLILRRQLVLH